MSNKYPKKAELLFEDMANNESHSSSRGRHQRMVGLHEIGRDTAFTAKVDAFIRKLDLLMSNV